MEFVPNGQVAEVVMTFLLDGQEVKHVFHFMDATAPEPWDATSLGAVAELAATHWNTHVAPVSSAALVLRDVVATSLSSATAPAVTHVPLGVSGDMTGGVAPNNVAFCVSLRTTDRGRSARGRLYMAGITTSVFLANTVTEAWATNVLAAWTAFWGSMDDASYIWVVYSRIRDGAPRAVGQALAVTAIVVVDRTLDSQRRRLPGRGV